MQFLKTLAVDHVVDLSRSNVIESVKEFLKLRKLNGVDVLYDPVGGTVTKASMKLLNWGAKILVIGFASGEVPAIPVNIALVKVLSWFLRLIGTADAVMHSWSRPTLTVSRWTI